MNAEVLRSVTTPVRLGQMVTNLKPLEDGQIMINCKVVCVFNYTSRHGTLELIEVYLRAFLVFPLGGIKWSAVRSGYFASYERGPD